MSSLITPSPTHTTKGDYAFFSYGHLHGYTLYVPCTEYPILTSLFMLSSKTDPVTKVDDFTRNDIRLTAQGILKHGYMTVTRGDNIS